MSPCSCHHQRANLRPPESPSPAMATPSHSPTRQRGQVPGSPVKRPQKYGWHKPTTPPYQMGNQDPEWGCSLVPGPRDSAAGVSLGLWPTIPPIRHLGPQTCASPHCALGSREARGPGAKGPGWWGPRAPPRRSMPTGRKAQKLHRGWDRGRGYSGPSLLFILTTTLKGAILSPFYTGDKVTQPAGSRAGEGVPAGRAPSPSC